MGRLLDKPSPIDATEVQLPRVDASAPWPEPPCPVNASAASSACTSDVAVLVAGEFRDFIAPYAPRDRRWQDLTPSLVWSRLYRAVVEANAPADLFVHCWDTPLAHAMLAQLPAPPCASVCETYGDEYARRVLGRYRGFRLIRGFLRFNNSKETPHVVDWFYKRYAALQLLARFEGARRRAYRAVVLVRPDVYVVSTAVRLTSELEAGVVYVHDTDHHHDSTDADTDADPMAHRQCGQMPNDWFAYGERGTMEQYLSAFPRLPALHAAMRSVPGSCDWWRCHNYRCAREREQ